MENNVDIAEAKENSGETSSEVGKNKAAPFKFTWNDILVNIMCDTDTITIEQCKTDGKKILKTTGKQITIQRNAVVSVTKKNTFAPFALIKGLFAAIGGGCAIIAILYRLFDIKVYWLGIVVFIICVIGAFAVAFPGKLTIKTNNGTDFSMRSEKDEANDAAYEGFRNAVLK